MKDSAPARKFLTFLAAAFALALGLAGTAFAGETGSSDEYSGVALTNSVLIDPFDPVPGIWFRHGCGYDCESHCDRDCRERYGHCRGDECRGEERFHCHQDCRWEGWTCEHDCDAPRVYDDRQANLGWWRCADECRNGDWWCDHDCRLEGWHCAHDCYIHAPCEHDRDCRGRPFLRPCDRDCRLEGERCFAVCYGRMIHEYEQAIQRTNEQQRHYEEQSRWYFEHVMDERHPDFDRDFDRHDGMDHHEGDRRDLDHHDVDHHDVDRHDADRHDADHHDADHHDLDHHDVDRHDEDRHDADHHDLDHHDADHHDMDHRDLDHHDVDHHDGREPPPPPPPGPLGRDATPPGTSPGTPPGPGPTPGPAGTYDPPGQYDPPPH